MTPAQITKLTQEWFGGNPNITIQVLETIAVLLILGVIRFFLSRLLDRRIGDAASAYLWRKNIQYLLTFIAVLVIGRIWIEGIGSLATFLGLLTAGLAIALRDPLTDLAGWFFIISQKTFKVGDRIQVGTTRGDVIDIRMLKFTILEIGNWVHADQSTGRIVHLPNHKIFKEDIFNYTAEFEFIWNELEVHVTFESDWRRAKQILEEIAFNQSEEFLANAQKQVKRASKSYLIHFKHLTPIVYTEVVERGVKLTLRHLTHPRQRRAMTQSFWESILDRFAMEPSIRIAYPTTRFYTFESK